MKTITLILAFSFLPIVALQARLGETIEQCKTRYGEPSTGIDENSIYFQKDGMLITVEHWDGKCVEITYCRGEALSPAEIERLLEVNVVNTVDGKWIKRAGNQNSITTWTTANRTRVALYETISFSLVITDSKGIHSLDEYRDRSRKAAASEKLKGF